MGALINTTHGPMDISLLERRDSVYDDDNERTTAIEYWLNGECVHRSVHVALKKMPSADGGTGGL